MTHIGIEISPYVSFGSWSPSSLFASSEVGVWYDPSDLSTMFQNSDGTTAVAVGDPVGYIADKSGNGFHATQATAAARPVLMADPLTLGSELVTNGTFDTDTAGWAVVGGGATISASGGELKVTGQTSSPASVQHQFTCEVGKWYQFSATYRMAGTGGTLVRVGAAAGGANVNLPNSTSATNTTYTGYIYTTSTTFTLTALVYGVSTTEGYFDNISVKEVTAWDMDRCYLKFDGVDDQLASAAGITITPDMTQQGGFVFGGGGTSSTYLTVFSVLSGTTNYFQLTRRPSISSAGTYVRGSAASPTIQGLTTAVTATNDAPASTPLILTSVFTDGAQSIAVDNGTPYSTANTWTESDSVAGAASFIFPGSSAYGETIAVYGAICVNRELSNDEATSLLEYMAGKTGVTL